MSELELGSSELELGFADLEGLCSDLELLVDTVAVSLAAGMRIRAE